MNTQGSASLPKRLKGLTVCAMFIYIIQVDKTICPQWILLLATRCKCSKQFASQTGYMFNTGELKPEVVDERKVLATIMANSFLRAFTTSGFFCARLLCTCTITSVWISPN